MRALLAIILLAAAAGPARAQLAREYAYPGAPMAQLLTASALTPGLVGDRPGPRARTGGRDHAGLVTQPRDRSLARTLAGVYPASKRAGAERMFRLLLESYPKLEDTIQVQRGDTAGAAALLVVASYEAANDVTVDPQAYTPVIEQLRASIATSRSFRQASPGQRRDLYEQLAAVGLFVLAARADLRAHPDAAIASGLADAARGYLARLLHVDADQVRITRVGLAFGRSLARTAPVAAAPEPGRHDRSAAARVAADIEKVGFYTRTSIGYGGMVAIHATPIVLFRSGDALLNMRNLNDPDGVESNRRTSPKDWTRWRRSGRTVERLVKGRWRRLEWAAEHGPLPRGFTLDRAYSSLTGVGTVSGPGSSQAVAWRSLTFDRSGRFSTAGGAAGTSETVTARSVRAAQTGRYEIAGYTLTLRFEDGRVVQRSVVADPKDTDVIWIDGSAYHGK